jgi:DNA-binding protein HU-beta
MSSFTDITARELRKWKEVNITWFWAFKTITRAARNGINPKTKEKLNVPALISPVFRAGKPLKIRVRD